MSGKSRFNLALLPTTLRMMCMKKSALFFVLFSLFLITQKIAVADVRLPRSDNLGITAEGLSWDFYRVAFSEAIWTSAFVDGDIIFNSKKYDAFIEGEYRSPDWYHKEFPWIYDAIYNEGGTPRIRSLNKWNNDVDITFGFPEFEGASSHILTAYEDIPIDQKIHLESIVRKGSQLFLSDLSAATNLNMQFRSSGASGNNKIHLIFLNSNYFEEEGFKLKPYEPQAPGFSGELSFVDHIEPLLHAAIPFINGKNSVDGFFVSDSRNVIKFSVCHIWGGHSDDMILALVGECLLRSLGLPDSSMNKRRGESLLGDPPAQGDGVALRLSPYDKLLLGLLYHSDMKPGSDFRLVRHHVLNILNQGDMK